MQQADLEILSNAKKWLEAGELVTLITVLKTWGASPRPAGSIMAITSKGNFCGSVSGGCIEEDLIELLSSEKWQFGKPLIKIYGDSEEQQRRYQLPCGGTVKLLLEPLENAKSIIPAIEAINSHQSITRQVNIKTGEVFFSSPDSNQTIEADDNSMRHTFGPQWRLLLIGAGELSHRVAEMAIPLGYQVTVCDPRTEYTNNWKLSGVNLTTEMPDDAVNSMKPDDRCAIITLTHDPKLDDLALVEALTSRAFYIGALGSKTTSKKRRERLETLGLSKQQLERLKAPVGIDIGSHKPAEIAISILAEMIATQNLL